MGTLGLGPGTMQHSSSGFASNPLPHTGHTEYSFCTLLVVCFGSVGSEISEVKMPASGICSVSTTETMSWNLSLQLLPADSGKKRSCCE